MTTITTLMPEISNLTTPWTPLNPPLNKCNYYVKKGSVVPFHISNPYGGIPQNLFINFIGWIVLLTLFTVIRRFVRNVRTRNDDDRTWTKVFYGPESSGGITEDDELDRRELQEQEEITEGLFSWIYTVFTLSDDKFLKKCGNDALQYLNFQRYLITFVFIMTIICICIILPINFQGEMQGTSNDFGHTTISNLNGMDPILWVHIVLTILFLPLGIVIMRRFSVNLKIQEEECISSRTIMLARVPRSYCTKEFLMRHFRETYSQYEIENIQIACDVSKLTVLDEKRDRAQKARFYCETRNAMNGTRLRMRNIRCGILCPRWCCGSDIDALDFYTEEERILTDKVEREKAKVKTRSIGIAFITFAELADAKIVREQHRKYCYGLMDNSRRPRSSFESNLKPKKWYVRFAPPPDDIYWENLDYYSHRLFIFKTFFINLLLFVVLFFFTSPAYILSELELVINMKTIAETLHLPEKINDFIPTLMLWTLTSLLPIIVAYSDWWLGHWRRSIENLWIMRKIFFYLLFMVLILPSIGLTTLRAMMESFILSTEDTHKKHFKWDCIFLPDNGAFFVNYVITSSLVGTGLELMRFSELFIYACRMAYARSVAETPFIRKANLYEFPFGVNYGWMLLIFALTSAYAVVCPLITPFGLFYLLMKHAVDRYNLYYAYKRSKINKNIHSTAVNFVIVSLLIQQLILLFFNVVRSGNGKILSTRAIFSVVMFAFFSLIFVFNIFFHFFKGVSPIQYVPANLLRRRIIANPNNDDIAEALGSSSKKGGYSPQKKQFMPDVLRPRSYPMSGVGNHNMENNAVTSTAQLVESPIDNDNDSVMVVVHDAIRSYDSIEK